MKLSITGARSELGRVLAQMPARGPDGSVHVNIAGQQANTLLHDGHAWKDFARTMPGTTPARIDQLQWPGRVPTTTLRTPCR